MYQQSGSPQSKMTSFWLEPGLTLALLLHVCFFLGIAAVRPGSRVTGTQKTLSQAESTSVAGRILMLPYLPLPDLNQPAPDEDRAAELGHRLVTDWQLQQLYEKLPLDFRRRRIKSAAPLHAGQVLRPLSMQKHCVSSMSFKKTGCSSSEMKQGLHSATRDIL